MQKGKWHQWLEGAKAHIRAKVEQPFRVIKQQFVLQKTGLRGLAKNHSKVMVFAALTNLLLGEEGVIRDRETWEQCISPLPLGSPQAQ